ncbi:MAG: diguanylate cyclase [Clostridia bacterium]|nr:diguanylate cyclase [Clostridia bacterium]
MKQKIITEGCTTHMTDAKQDGKRSHGEHRRASVSIRLLNALLLVVCLLLILFSLFELQRTTRYAHSLYQLEQERQRCDMAIQKLMDGSDYLTTQVQQYVVTGERRYMDNYWREIYETKSREMALLTILSMNITTAEREAAQAGKQESDALMKGEIWAMRMVAESTGIEETDMPAAVAALQLPPVDVAKSAQEKRDTAIAFVFGPDYSVYKDTIRGNVNAFRNEIASRYAAEALSTLEKTERTTKFMAGGLVVFLALLAGSVIGFARLVVFPLVGFSNALSERNEEEHFVPLEEKGVSEIRRFAEAFNILSAQVEQKTRRLERMGYVDYLTEVPNRASITQYVTSLIEQDQHPLGLLIIDIDNFKIFNDTYGHALGDQVLRQVAKAVCAAQPEESGIAGRLCGEEFIVAMQNANEQTLQKTAEAALQNVRRITKADVGLPNLKDFHITVSVGGMLWRGEPTNFILLLSQADKALYVSKGTGKDKYTFYDDVKETA